MLSLLSMAEDRTLRMSELAQLTNGSLSRLSNVASRLERRGWLRRCPDPGDGRYTNATLTEEGWELVVRAAPGHVAAVRHDGHPADRDVEGPGHYPPERLPGNSQ